MAAAGPALALHQVSKWYRTGTLALSDVSIAVSSGARASLVGPNGAGKSTAVKLLVGTLAPSSGSASVLGVRTDSAAYIDTRRRVGVVPQVTGWYRDLTAREYLDLARALYRVASYDAPVQRLGLGPHLDKQMSDLSGGLQKRLSLAAALVGEPDVLILDEPSLGLDPVATQEIHDYLRALAPGRTMLICTNDLGEAEAISDEVIILKEGRVALQGHMAGLRQLQQRILLRASQGPGALLEVARAAGLQGEIQEDAAVIQVADYDAAAPDLVRRALAAGLDVLECRPLQSGLEAAFFQAMAER